MSSEKTRSASDKPLILRTKPPAPARPEARKVWCHVKRIGGGKDNASLHKWSFFNPPAEVMTRRARGGGIHCGKKGARLLPSACANQKGRLLSTRCAVDLAPEKGDQGSEKIKSTLANERDDKVGALPGSRDIKRGK